MHNRAFVLLLEDVYVCVFNKQLVGKSMLNEWYFILFDIGLNDGFPLRRNSIFGTFRLMLTKRFGDWFIGFLLVIVEG